MRAFLYEPDPPLDVAQADALDLIVSHAPVRMSEVAALLRVDPSTATRTVARLQKLALVDRTTDSGDARVVLVVPSGGGRRLHARVRGRSNVLLSELLDTFEAEDRERLASLMERLVGAVEAQRAAPGARASTAASG
ncbi:MarR family transcriptional regulator [Iamia sp. SCSIO 61187]|uniref:MarR family winged helix-turn-helix transcriptional regulator n=1 Tax=Iamia sp. SCSIO 61187 TaxID=2722752 RepID=UPI001C6316E2|nr:MarR family transcriptional regulator [Iamia sp. SCSIO 61187]QYG94426.1 MarR family transcriptional regulator [Iamia sp. SCSIO 61187]